MNTNKTQESMALYIQQALKGIGVNVELMPLDSNAMSQRSLDMNNTAWELNPAATLWDQSRTVTNRCS